MHSKYLEYLLTAQVLLTDLELLLFVETVQ
jgi:hypothetical protein